MTFFLNSCCPCSLYVEAAIVLPEPCLITLKLSMNSGLNIICRHLSSSNFSADELRGDFDAMVEFPSVSLKRSDCSSTYLGDCRFFVRKSFRISNGFWIGLSVTNIGPAGCCGCSFTASAEFVWFVVAYALI